MQRNINILKAIPPEVILAVIEVRLEQGKIQAIKEFRTAMPEISLSAAKDWVDAFDASCQKTYCEPFPTDLPFPFPNFDDLLRGR